MATNEDILHDLITSKDEGVFLGMLIQLQESSKFIITRVENILSDLTDPTKKTIVLKQRDIRGEITITNPVALQNIKSTRVYRELQGVAQ